MFNRTMKTNARAQLAVLLASGSKGCKLETGAKPVRIWSCLPEAFAMGSRPVRLGRDFPHKGYSYKGHAEMCFILIT